MKTLLNHKLFKSKAQEYENNIRRGFFMRHLRHSRYSGYSFRLLSLSLIMVVILLIMIQSSAAASISVTKAVIDYKNVLKGGYAEDYVIVATDTEFDVPLTHEVIGQIADWISFDPNLNNETTIINISRTHGQLIKIIVKPPADIPTGNYSGGIRLITGTINNPEGQYGSQLQAAFLIRINIEVTGIELLSCNIGGLTIKDTEIGNPLEFSMSVTNNGNVRVWPNVSIDVWNQDQTKIVGYQSSDFGMTEVLPTTSKILYDTFDNNLRIGQYWAYATVYPCGQSELLSFSVLERGAIADYGELLRIENPSWTKIGDVVPINAIFKNNGERVVSAKFKGVIKSNNKIAATLDSDYYDIAPGEISNITVYFTPKKLGQYQISGRVLYNNKLTYEKGSILTVNEGTEITDFNMLYLIIIIIIIIIILLLLIRIKKKKQRLRRPR
jgi:hypothetical protein